MFTPIAWVLIGSATWWLALILLLEKGAEAQREAVTQPGSHGWREGQGPERDSHTGALLYPRIRLGWALEKQQRRRSTEPRSVGGVEEDRQRTAHSPLRGEQGHGRE